MGGPFGRISGKSGCSASGIGEWHCHVRLFYGFAVGRLSRLKPRHNGEKQVYYYTKQKNRLEYSSLFLLYSGSPYTEQVFFQVIEAISSEERPFSSAIRASVYCSMVESHRRPRSGSGAM